MRATAMAISLLAIFISSSCAVSKTTGAARDKKIPEGRYAWKVNWHSLEDGIRRVMAEKKPMLVDFAVPEGCSRCNFLQKNVYSSDKIVEKINSDFIPILVDLSKPLTRDEKTLGEKYDYKNECMLLFLDYRGKVIDDPMGRQMCFADKIEPEVFIEHLDYVIKKSRQLWPGIR
jgi:thioredoxin-related protein